MEVCEKLKNCVYFENQASVVMMMREVHTQARTARTRVDDAIIYGALFWLLPSHSHTLLTSHTQTTLLVDNNHVCDIH